MIIMLIFQSHVSPIDCTLDHVGLSSTDTEQMQMMPDAVKYIYHNALTRCVCYFDNSFHQLGIYLKIHDFHYFGNSYKDLPIWRYTKKIIHTNASKELKTTIDSLDFEKIEIPAYFILKE